MSDPNFSSVALLLHADGTNGSTTFTDSSSYAHTSTGYGTVALSTAQSKFGGSSLAISQSGSYVEYAGGAEFGFPGDLTIEASVFITSFAPSLQTILNIGPYGSGTLVRLQSGTIEFFVLGGYYPFATSITTGVFHHVAVTRQSGVIRAFLDGVQQGASVTDSAAIPAGLVTVGKSVHNTSEYINGYLDEVRITQGVARYTANFTPPTEAFAGISAALLFSPMQVISASGSPIVGRGVLGVSGPVGALSAFGGANAALLAPMMSLAAYGGANAALTGTFPTLFANGHNSSGENAFAGAAPVASLVFAGGASAKLTAPSPALAITGTFSGFGAADLAAPAPTLAATGTVSAVANAALSAPMASLIGYSGAVCSITLSGQATLQASGTTGAIGAAAVTCPLFDLKASGTVNSLSSASLVAPSPQLSGTANVMYLVAPMATLTAIGTAVVTATFEAYSINLSHRPPRLGDNTAPVDEVTRYTNFPFTQIVRYQNSYFGVAADGLYLLEGTTDAGAAIPYAVRTCIDDFKVPEKKTAAAAYFGGRLGPDAAITLYAGEQGAESYAFTTPRGQGAQNHREKFGRGVKNRYFAVGVTGEGALELDSLTLETTNLSRKI